MFVPLDDCKLPCTSVTVCEGKKKIKPTNKCAYQLVSSNILNVYVVVLVNGLICRRTTDGAGVKLSYVNKRAVGTALWSELSKGELLKWRLKSLIWLLDIWDKLCWHAADTEGDGTAVLDYSSYGVRPYWHTYLREKTKQNNAFQKSLPQSPLLPFEDVTCLNAVEPLFSVVLIKNSIWRFLFE